MRGMLVQVRLARGNGMAMVRRRYRRARGHMGVVVYAAAFHERSACTIVLTLKRIICS
jgi:hypothetical protein